MCKEKKSVSDKELHLYLDVLYCTKELLSILKYGGLVTLYLVGTDESSSLVCKVFIVFYYYSD